MPNSCNYKVSGFADSLSLISEPPDIKNWFSSYAYESPELNTYENCEDSGLGVSDSEEETGGVGERGNKEKGEEKKLEGTTINKDKPVSGEVDSNTTTKYTDAAKNCDKTKSVKRSKLFISIAKSCEPEMPSSCNYKVSGFSDSMSLVSEPPDIKNWFSSYAYESPELNTYKNCEDSGLRVGDSEEEAVDDGERGNQEEGEEKKLKGTTRNKDKPVFDEVDSSTSTKYRNVDKDFDHTKAFKVLGSLSDSVMLSPEPPHVGQWFSSYVYESPQLDTDIDFSDSQSQCINFDAKKSWEQRKIRRDAERNLLPTAEMIFSRGLSTCDNFVKDTNSQLQCSDKAINAVAGNRPNLVDMPNEKRNEHILKAKLTENNKIASSNVRKRDIDGEDFIGREQLDNASSGKSKRSSDKLAQRSGLLQDPPHMENIVDITGGIADTENNRERISENGFVSTRKIDEVRSGASNSKRSMDVPLVVNKEYVSKRKPFSEKTNFQHSDGLEVTGKWKCPRKSNPKMGPPLKQLRLEQWVSRV